VALARALGSDPEILFFDEPLSAIDYRLRKTLEVELKDLHARTGKTFVYITHSLEEAMVMSDRIAIMQAGRFVQIGRPVEIYRAPVNRFVAAFMGEVNILGAEGGQLAGLGVQARGAHAILRPEDLHLGPGGPARLTAMMRHKMMLGSRTQVHFDRAGHTLIAEVPSAEAEGLVAGAEVALSFDPASLAWVQA
jgi:spermidine/putrescine transport system ATP-binding protein